MFTLFFRGAILYIVMILTMRGLGKRQLGEFQPYEFAMTILLADVISAPMESVSVPLLHGLLPVAAMFIVHGIISMAGLKWDRVRAAVSGKPTVVISKGIIDRRALDRLCMSISDLLEGLRGAGFMNPGEVGTAIVEANGSISAFADSLSRTPKNSEMNIDPGYEGMPLMLVMDGKIQPHNLRTSAQDEKWLLARLAARGYAPESICLAWLDTHGIMTVQTMDGTTLSFPALEPGKVGW